MIKLSASALPSETSVEQPLLLFIFLSGGPAFAVHARAAYQPLADHFDLDALSITVTRHHVSGDGNSTPKWHNIVQYARWGLVKGGYLMRGVRGIWQLSEAGIVAARNILTNELQRDWRHLIRREAACFDRIFRQSNEIDLADLGL